jgi:hypothetical protein
VRDIGLRSRLHDARDVRCGERYARVHTNVERCARVPTNTVDCRWTRAG